MRGSQTPPPQRLGGVDTQPVLLAETVQGVKKSPQVARIIGQEDHVIGKQQEPEAGGVP